MTTACTSCGEHVRVADNGRHLTAQPVRLGIYDPTDGQPLSTRDIAARIRNTGLAGHAPHHCPSGQAALFTTPEVNA